MGNELPTYKCHKTVQAFKIKSVINNPDGSVEVVPEDSKFQNVTMKELHLGDHKTAIGGYYVRYTNGYDAWSPAKAFEDGYSLLIKE